MLRRQDRETDCVSVEANGSYDVVVIGSGVGGGAVAFTLADTGARILILERGERLPREAENWSPEA
ncbi:MAG TPA: FAD-dependent oxidoreductase, partial [Burkholderiales bacterium]|nr:FAD-dependent oxidoreductase [Burkholderiales bacterium]